jgi:membrane-anchored protein YejM (alkaline phosphatase superfamily)
MFDAVGSTFAVQAWLSKRASEYTRVVAALCLTAPFLVLALTRQLGGVDITSLAGLYAGLVLFGYYVLVLLVLVTLVFALSMFSTRVAVAACGTLIAATLFLLIVDSFVYPVYRFHLNAFWLQYVFTSFSGIGISTQLVALAVLVAAGVAALEWLLFRIARRLPNRRRFVIGGTAFAILAFSASQAIHVIAYDQNDTRFTDITPRLPFYYPITSHRDAAKYASLLPMITDTGSSSAPGSSLSLAYPLRNVPLTAPAGKRPANILMIVLESWRFDTMNETVSPRMEAFSRRSSVFLNHFSSGNSTPSGIFSLFYGIHPTYWTAVKANSSAIDNPVLIDALNANGYALGIFADSHFDRHKIKDAVFRGIDVHENFEGSTADAKDRDLTERLIAFSIDNHRAGTPFFGFAFYKSTHFSYYYPKDAARFRPAHKLNIATATRERDPTLFFNDYRNAVSYVDSLVGGLIDSLDASGVLENTIVVITSDHAEEFNDNKANYWGHCGNFTGYQTRVPMIVYVPGAKPRRVSEVTAHVDVPPTLMIEGLGCGKEIGDYSNGRNLFGPLEGERPIVICSYVNHAVVMGDDVFVVYPVYVQKYKLWDVNAKAGPSRTDLARMALDEMHRFHRRTDS